MTAPPNSLAFADNMALRIFVLLLCLFAASLPLVSAKCFKKCSQFLYRAVIVCAGLSWDHLVPYPSLPYPQRYRSRLMTCIQRLLREIQLSNKNQKSRLLNGLVWLSNKIWIKCPSSISNNIWMCKVFLSRQAVECKLWIQTHKIQENCCLKIGVAILLSKFQILCQKICQN